MNQWVTIVIVAIIGAVFYFLFQDWVNPYIPVANPTPHNPGPVKPR